MIFAYESYRHRGQALAKLIDPRKLVVPGPGLNVCLPVRFGTGSSRVYSHDKGSRLRGLTCRRYVSNRRSELFAPRVAIATDFLGFTQAYR